MGLLYLYLYLYHVGSNLYLLQAILLVTLDICTSVSAVHCQLVAAAGTRDKLLVLQHDTTQNITTRHDTSQRRLPQHDTTRHITTQNITTRRDKLQ